MSKQGKKKNQKVMSLQEFNQVTPLASEAPPQSSINWADEMEKLDDTVKPVDFNFDRSQLPTTTKAYAEPDVDLSQVPNKPPYTAHISNISFEANEDKVRSILPGILNFRVSTDDRGALKGYGFLDFADRESLIAALKNNGVSLLNRPLRIQLESNHRQQRHRDHDLRSDEADWRRHNTEEDTAPSRQYGDQQRRSYGQQRRGGHQQGYHQREHQRDHPREHYNQGYQRRQHSGFKSNRFENTEADTQSTSSATSTPTISMTERPKLNLAPRTKTTSENKAEEVTEKSSSIFGSAKPVNTAAREREIEEKLKRDKLEAEQLEKEKREKEDTQEEEPVAQEVDFHVAGGKPKIHKNDNNNNSIKNRSGSNVSPQQRYHKKSESEPPKENPWKTKSSAAQLFTKESSESNYQKGNRQPSDDQRRSYPPKRTEYLNKDRPNRDNYNRDNKDRRNVDRVKPMNKNPRGDRQMENRSLRPRGDLVNSESTQNTGANINFNNKFSNLAVDVEDAEEIYEDSNNEQEE